MVTQFIVGLVAFCKTFNKLSEYIDMAVIQWIKFDVDRIGGEAEARKQEHEVLNARFKVAETDEEQRVLLRLLARDH